MRNRRGQKKDRRRTKPMTVTEVSCLIAPGMLPQAFSSESNRPEHAVEWVSDASGDIGVGAQKEIAQTAVILLIDQDRRVGRSKEDGIYRLSQASREHVIYLLK